MLKSSLFLSRLVCWTSIRSLWACVIQSSCNKDSRKVGLGSIESINWEELLSILVSSSAVKIRWSSSVTKTLSGNYILDKIMKQIISCRGKSAHNLLLNNSTRRHHTLKVVFVGGRGEFSRHWSKPSTGFCDASQGGKEISRHWSSGPEGDTWNEIVPGKNYET